MHHYWVEFSAVAVAHLLAVASPGPDFALVVKQSVAHGRRTAIWTSVGIGTAILLQVTYSLLGIGLLIRGSTAWFNSVKYAGAAYLAWLGVSSLRAKPRKIDGTDGTSSSAPRARAAFALGFVTNVLNPKATLFFISLFVVLVSPQTPRLIQAGYGVWMSIATITWFTLVAVLFTQADVRRRFLRHGHWIERALGVFFLACAASLAVATLK
jgi:RhtB (resistance to homoserine/threonine) family protein